MTFSDYLLIVAAVLTLTLLFIQMGRRGRRKQTGQGQLSYVEALRHLVDGEVDLAYSRLVETVRDDTSNIDAYILLGDILRRRGNLERALKIHKDVTVRTDLSPHTNRMLLKSLSLDYLAARRWGAAERTLNELDRITRGDDWARLRLLKVYEAQKDWGAAFELARNLEDHPQVGTARIARYRVEQALEMGLEGQYHRARVVLKDALKYDPACADAYGMIGDFYAEEDRIEDALEWWEKVADKVPDRAAEVFDRLEESLYELGEFERMSGIYERFIDANPENVEAALAFAHFLERKGEVPRAIELLERCRARSADPARLDRSLVLLYYRGGDSEKALNLALKTCQSEQPPADRNREVEVTSEGAGPDWYTSGGTWDPSLGEEDFPE